MTTSAEMIAASRQAYEELIRRVHEEAVGLMQAHPEWDVDAANASLARVGAPPLPTTRVYTITVPIAVSFVVEAINAQQAATLGERLVETVDPERSPERFLNRLARNHPTDVEVTGPVKLS